MSIFKHLPQSSSQSGSKNFERLFIEPDMKALKYNDSIENIMYLPLPEFIKSKIFSSKLAKAHESYLEMYTLHGLIYEFTKSCDYNGLQLNNLRSFCESLQGDSKLIIDDKKFIHICTNEGEIIFQPFSVFLPSIAKFKPEILTDNRLGKCHIFVIDIASQMPEGAEVVTGYVHALTSNSAYLHSWIEVDGYAIDYTLNSIMNAEGYYNLCHIKPLTRILCKDVVQDKKYIESLEFFNYKEYLVFRDEIMQDLHKNEHLFNLNIDDSDDR